MVNAIPVDEYSTSLKARRRFVFPSRRINFYINFLKNIYKLSSEVKKGTYTEESWCRISYNIFSDLEKVGARFHVKGLDNINLVGGPAVFIGNHMSTLETMVLPMLICPRKKISYIVKQALLDYPWFGDIMRGLQAIPVGRKNPTEDLKAVLRDGKKLLDTGRSIVVFPQTTRSNIFDASQFNSIGVKLAKRAGVPVIPIALKTDLWANGRFIKDMGPLYFDKIVHLEFGAPIEIAGNGKLEHQQIISFIEEKLSLWSKN